MSISTIKLSEIKSALNREELNFKIKNSELNGTKEYINFIDTNTKAKLHGKIIRSFNEGEVYHWPLLNHENVARLIDIICIRDNLYIYLTVDHEITLKNIVHDKNFVYDSRCFDRKLSYAKGIFCGLNYLHEKALSLMNICDDNVIISELCDTAIITNFEHLTYVRKATLSKLHVPQMYLAPETEKGEFDAIKAEIWASGTLMLDMFLAHMVPWAIIEYKPKKVMRIVDEMSLDLLQAANAGSVVSETNLEKFKVFLKCFFKQNPLDRIPAKYASIASFLQNRTQYNELRNISKSNIFTEDMLPLDSSILRLNEEHRTACLNPTYDPSFNSLPEEMRVENGMVDVSLTTTQQDQRSEKIGEIKTEIDLSHKHTSKSNITLHEKENFSSSAHKLTSPSTYRTGKPSFEAETNNDLQKTTKSWEVTNPTTKTAMESYYNCYQTRSLSFINPERCDDNRITFQLNRSGCYSNDKFPIENKSIDGDLKNNDNFLNHILHSDDNNTTVEFDSNLDNSDNRNNLTFQSGYSKATTSKKMPESTETRHLRNELQIEQRIPYDLEFETSRQAFKEPIAKPPRYSRNPPLLFIKPEIQSVIDKIVFLRKCYISIQTHQRVFISDEFSRRQGRFVREYQITISQENLRLRELLRKKYKLKFEDITKLISCINSRVIDNLNQHENLSLVQNFYENHRNKFLQSREMEYVRQGGMEKIDYCRDEPLTLTNTPIVKLKRNYSYCRAIENSKNNTNKQVAITCLPRNRKTKTDLEGINLVKENELNKRLTSAKKKKKELKTENDDVEMMKQHEQAENYVEIYRKEKYDSRLSPEKATPKSIKKKQIIVKEKNEKKSKKHKEKADKAIKKETEKQLNAFKKQDAPKHSWLSFLCPRGKIEEQTPLADALCETCKLNLEIV